MVLTSEGRRHEIVKEGDRYFLDGTEVSWAAIEQLKISPGQKERLAPSNEKQAPRTKQNELGEAPEGAGDTQVADRG